MGRKHCFESTRTMQNSKRRNYGPHAHSLRHWAHILVLLLGPTLILNGQVNLKPRVHPPRWESHCCREYWHDYTPGRHEREGRFVAWLQFARPQSAIAVSGGRDWQHKYRCHLDENTGLRDHHLGRALYRTVQCSQWPIGRRDRNQRYRHNEECLRDRNVLQSTSCG